MEDNRDTQPDGRSLVVRQPHNIHAAVSQGQRDASRYIAKLLVISTYSQEEPDLLSVSNCRRRPTQRHPRRL